MGGKPTKGKAVLECVEANSGPTGVMPKQGPGRKRRRNTRWCVGWNLANKLSSDKDQAKVTASNFSRAYWTLLLQSKEGPVIIECDRKRGLRLNVKLFEDSENPFEMLCPFLFATAPKKPFPLPDAK